MNKDRLGFGTCFNCVVFGCHCHVGEIDEAMCGVSDHIVVSLEV